MSYGPSYIDNQPIWWLRRLPVYATTILTGLLALGVVVTVVMSSARVNVELLAFLPSKFVQGRLWTPLTYWLINPANFFTLLGLFCFYSWGVQVERYLGRKRFLSLFAAMVLGQALLCLVAYRLGIGVVTQGGVILGAPFAAGSYELTAAFLIAFATLYPGVEYFGWVPLKWFAFACLAIGSLMYFPGRDWVGLSKLWFVCGMAFGMIRYYQRGMGFEMPNVRGWFRRKPKFRVLPKAEYDEGPRRWEGKEEDEEESVDATMAEVDALLDKIAQHGIGSLTAKERAKLERAREGLMKRDTRGR